MSQENVEAFLEARRGTQKAFNEGEVKTALAKQGFPEVTVKSAPQ